MSTSGPLTPGAANQPDLSGWTNASGIGGEDDVPASFAIGAGPDVLADRIAGRLFGFAIPVGSVIIGILLRVRHRDTSGNIKDKDIYLSKTISAGATPVGSNKGNGAAIPTAYAYTNYGGAADLWGTTWTLAEINASTFGPVLTYENDDASGHTVEVDNVTLTITYALGPIGKGNLSPLQTVSRSRNYRNKIHT